MVFIFIITCVCLVTRSCGGWVRRRYRSHISKTIQRTEPAD
ncbi:m135R [Myxoma virus]|uniref:M135R n=1 Tax=Myxoma virus TaxID=10273 RepID=B2CWP2_9POXV|nr:m135R [Myxoma virus]ACB28930.1 m135R [recombinant virus 6918VP60-T2]